MPNQEVATTNYKAAAHLKFVSLFHSATLSTVHSTQQRLHHRPLLLKYFVKPVLYKFLILTIKLARYIRFARHLEGGSGF